MVFTFKLIFVDIVLPNVFSATCFIGLQTTIHLQKPPCHTTADEVAAPLLIGLVCTEYLHIENSN